MIVNNYPKLKKIIKISGSVGHDIFTIKKNINERKKTNKIVIGVGCWGFDFFRQKTIKSLFKSNS